MNECVVCKGPTERPFCASCMAQANRDADAVEAGREASTSTGGDMSERRHDDRYWGPHRTAEQRRRTCGHTHDCGCGMPNRGHVDPSYSRQGFCDARCPECDRLDAEGR